MRYAQKQDKRSLFSYMAPVFPQVLWKTILGRYLSHVGTVETEFRGKPPQNWQDRRIIPVEMPSGRELTNSGHGWE
ncbi:MAG: hypothetical protein ACLQPD_04725 [Desulfomonilaceae bacterium]